MWKRKKKYSFYHHALVVVVLVFLSIRVHKGTNPLLSLQHAACNITEGNERSGRRALWWVVAPLTRRLTDSFYYVFLFCVALTQYIIRGGGGSKLFARANIFVFQIYVMPVFILSFWHVSMCARKSQRFLIFFFFFFTFDGHIFCFQFFSFVIYTVNSLLCSDEAQRRANCFFF